jgi:large subunit ribosomal protein L3
MDSGIKACRYYCEKEGHERLLGRMGHENGYNYSSGTVFNNKLVTTLQNIGNRCLTAYEQLEDVQVVDVRTKEKHGYNALQVGCTNRKNVTKPLAMHYAKLNVSPKQHLAEFPVTRDAVLPIGTTLNAAHFVPGQYVDATAYS